jgi:hypothetical protein
MKGKPWSVNEERQLRELVEVKTPLKVIMVKLNKSVDSIRKKCVRLGLEVDGGIKKINAPSSSTVKLPSELFSVEEALKMLAGALNALKAGGVDKAEIIRLRSIIQGAEAYIDRVAEYMDYRGLEAELLEWKDKYEQLKK